MSGINAMNKPQPTIDQVCRVLEINADAKTPEQSLWVAVIVQSVQDLRMKQFKPAKTAKQRKHIQSMRTENIRQIASSLRFHRDSYFETVCDYAGLNHEYARRIIGTLHGIN
jgi:hypothetical protein